MILELPQIPNLDKLKYITPSIYLSFSGCLLKNYLISRSEYQRFIYRQPKTLIGIVSHEIIEKINKGHFDHLNNNEIELKIKDLYFEGCSSLLKQSLFKYSWQTIEEWPGFYLRLSRLKILAKRLVASRSAHIPVASNLTLVETNIEIFDGKLKGRPDRIYVSNNKIVIEDYKTGKIFDESGNIFSTITSQMLIYSFVCSIVYQSENVIYRVINTDNQIYEETVNLDIAEQEALKALRALELINNKIDETECDNIFYLASPSKVQCGNCPFKFMCKPFWDSGIKDELSCNSFHIKGKLIGINIIDDNYELVILSDKKLCKVIRVRFDEKLADFVNSNILIVDLIKKQENQEYLITQPSPKTLIWRDNIF
ncbi:PD-(D/E)XK nuclease family protein [Neobacillus sp. PS3-34]|uniref:PD-(D/E)XK nuclease family protein n=1 Tax=Neobacillus sp. PS3-34 TaxID=3070678 RepID=UPI0027E195BD|nr:PD-(D/E)XK nuclease family protein [Neobacillus sp. PS3-34]WML48485.1 PD-(D/E)XK nuclease family protein [Neobacillus sp. PS3-34]